MNRKKVTIKISHLRTIKPHYLYKSVLVSMLINHVMRKGEKSIANRIVCAALDLVRERTHGNPLDVLEQAVLNAQPKMKVKRMRMGGATHAVPTPIRPKESLSLALRYIVQSMKERGERTSMQKLAAELLDTAAKRGGAFKKAQTLEKLAESNRVYGGYNPTATPEAVNPVTIA
jgi:small subunit ribosomal protein S7